jgi:hypothetical protein
MARIKATSTVNFALWALRIYLLVLLTLIGVKFVRVFHAQKTAEAAAARSAATTNGAAGGLPAGQGPAPGL